MQIQCRTLEMFSALPLIASVMCTSTLSAVEEYVAYDYCQQLNSDVEFFEAGDDEKGREFVDKVQSGSDEYLYLGSNEVFFTPNGTLILSGEELNEKFDLNQGKEFSGIKGLTCKNDQIEWGFIAQNGGDSHADFFLSGDTKAIGTDFSIQIDEGEEASVAVTKAQLSDGFFSLDFGRVSEGVHTFRMKIKEAKKL